MQARYYDPVIGRFYSNDPVGYTAKNLVMSFNRYLYVNTNPKSLGKSLGHINFFIFFYNPILGCPFFSDKHSIKLINHLNLINFFIQQSLVLRSKA